MGAPMARHLLRAGHEVRVWNRTRAKAESTGAPVADTPAAAVAAADVVITILADGPSVGEVDGARRCPHCRRARSGCR